MIFNSHFELEGLHAFLSASKYHWLNYDSDKLTQSFDKYMAAQKGTRLHAFAKEAIELKQRLPKTKNTLNMYVNDVIGYKMQTEQVLYYSDNCFGTADAILYRPRKQNEHLASLKVFDLKTGESKTSMKQLEIYSGLFCLEYKISPFDIDFELRIYQSDEIIVHNPQPEDIRWVMDRIIEADKQIEMIKAGKRL